MSCVRSCYDTLCLMFFFFVLGFIVFMLIFLPQELKFTVTEASLTKFDYIPSPNNTLFYSFALKIAIRNPNKKIGVYFRRIQVISHYRKKRFSSVTLNSTMPFYQGHKNTTVLPVKIEGQQFLLLKEKDMKQYDSETGLGFYSIDVKIALRVRGRYGKIKTRPYKPKKIDCKLNIPLSNSNNGTTLNGQRFRATICSNIQVLNKMVL